MRLIANQIGAGQALTVCLVGVTAALTWLLFSKEIRMFYVFAVFFVLAWSVNPHYLAFTTCVIFGAVAVILCLASLKAESWLGD